MARRSTSRHFARSVALNARSWAMFVFPASVVAVEPVVGPDPIGRIWSEPPKSAPQQKRRRNGVCNSNPSLLRPFPGENPADRTSGQGWMRARFACPAPLSHARYATLLCPLPRSAEEGHANSRNAKSRTTPATFGGNRRIWLGLDRFGL